MDLAQTTPGCADLCFIAHLLKARQSRRQPGAGPPGIARLSKAMPTL